MTPYDLATEVAVELRGTCNSLLGALDHRDAEEMENNDQFCARLDELVFCCERCNWWFEQSEMAEDCGDEWICEECGNED